MKAQAATEFMMTYGWVLVLLGIAISTLAYFNVFNTTRYYPDECQLTPTIICKSGKISTNSIQLLIRNEFGEDLSMYNITIISNEGCNSSVYHAPGGINNGEEQLISISCGSSINGERYRGELMMNYQGSGTLHTAYGKITGQRE